jgi:MSHA biogenesis protein MshN
VVVEGGMSVINKMLQDLDRRQALAGAGEAQIVRPSPIKERGREWFWRILAVLLAGLLGWMGWVALQIMPGKPLVTDAAYQAAAAAKSHAAQKPVAPPAPAAPAPAPVAAAAEASPPTSDALRLAVQIETPLKESVPEPVKAQAPKPAAAPAAKPKPPTVDKRARTPSATDIAEAHFRRAVLLLNHGRVSEAEDQLIAALHADAGHQAARQTYVALLLEQSRTDAARRVLQDALALNPAQPTFALALARIHTEQRDYYAALEVMDRTGSIARNADFQALRGAVLQRLARHGEAVEAYRNAIRGGAQPATTWVGLGISLEASGRKAEAAQAYRRALAAGPIAAEAREYAESRARALE